MNVTYVNERHATTIHGLDDSSIIHDRCPSRARKVDVCSDPRNTQIFKQCFHGHDRIPLETLTANHSLCDDLVAHGTRHDVFCVQGIRKPSVLEITDLERCEAKVEDRPPSLSLFFHTVHQKRLRLQE